jgi:hypothetical protein
VVKAIQDAVGSGNFAEAERLLGAYRDQVVADWHAAESESERQAMAADVNALLEWARITTVSARAHAQNRLVLLGRGSAYAGVASGRSAVNLDA